MGKEEKGKIHFLTTNHLFYPILSLLPQYEIWINTHSCAKDEPGKKQFNSVLTAAAVVVPGVMNLHLYNSRLSMPWEKLGNKVCRAAAAANTNDMKSEQCCHWHLTAIHNKILQLP